MIVATELDQARELLGDDRLRWTSGHTVCLDLGLRHRRGDPFVVSDLDEAGWIERFTAPDPSLAPEGEELVQAQMPIRPGESAEQAAAAPGAATRASLPDWRERETWRRRQVMDARSGALDMPGSTWRDRPAVDRGDGVFLAGDMVAAPGLLSEVSWASAVEAGRLALDAARTVRRPQLRRSPERRRRRRGATRTPARCRPNLPERSDRRGDRDLSRGHLRVGPTNDGEAIAR